MTEGSRAPEAVDAATLRVLTATRSAARTMSDTLLTHLPDLGDLPTQRALDAWVEQAADTLRALSEAVEERLLELGSGRTEAGTDAGADATRDATAHPAAPRRRDER